jgi:hypothetical protein
MLIVVHYQLLMAYLSIPYWIVESEVGLQNIDKHVVIVVPVRRYGCFLKAEEIWLKQIQGHAFQVEQYFFLSVEKALR